MNEGPSPHRDGAGESPVFVELDEYAALERQRLHEFDELFLCRYAVGRTREYKIITDVVRPRQGKCLPSVVIDNTVAILVRNR